MNFLSHYVLTRETQRNWEANSFVKSYKHCRDKKKKKLPWSFSHPQSEKKKMYMRTCFKENFDLGYVLIRNGTFAYYTEIINTHFK